MGKFEFNEERHEYKLDGVILPSVTQIIQMLNNHEGIPEENLEYAKQRGTAVHKACEIYNLGKKFAEPLDPVIEPYFEAWKKFLAENNVKVTHAECMNYHATMRYAGKFDAKGIIGSDRWLLDIKAVAQLSPATGVQLAAYMAMTGETLRRGAVQLKPDGTYRFEEYKSPSDWPTFVSCLTVFNFKRKHYGK